MRPFPKLVAPLLVAMFAAAPLVIAASPAAAQPAAEGAPSRYAVIDTRRAIMETEEGLRVQATLKKLFDSRQVELSSKEKQLQQEHDDLITEEKKKGSSPALEQRKEAWQQKAAALQETLVNYQREMQRKEGEMTNPMLTKMQTILKKVATQSGYDVVVDKAAAPYFRADLDITDKIIQLYNADGAPQGKSGGKAPAAPDAKKPKADPKPPAAPAPKK